MKGGRKSESARTLAAEQRLALHASLAKGREQLRGELRIGPTGGSILSIEYGLLYATHADAQWQRGRVRTPSVNRNANRLAEQTQLKNAITV